MTKDERREYMRGYVSEYRKKFPERVRAWAKKYRESRKGNIAEYRKAYNKRNRDKISAISMDKYYSDPVYRARLLERSGKFRVALKNEFLDEYGARCACCGETERAFLSMDHFGADRGIVVRQITIGVKGKINKPAMLRGPSEYARLKKLGWPKDGIRILCMNCNFATRHGATCPHQST